MKFMVYTPVSLKEYFIEDSRYYLLQELLTHTTISDRLFV